VVGSPIANRVDSYGEQEADTYAFFGSIDWQFQPTLTLNLGARYTSEVREFEGCSIDSPSSTRGLGFSAAFTAIALARPLLIPGSNIPTEFAKPNGCFTLDHETNNAGLYRGKLDEDNVAGRVALDWTPADDLLFYASYSRGFKSGSFPVFPSSDQAQYIPVKQEQLDAYEIGGKTAFLDRRLRVNFAGFYYDYKDKQLVGRLLDPIFGPLQKLVNAPKSEVRGVELEVQVRPMRGLLLAASAIYLKTELKEFEGVDQSGDPVDLNGEPFNFSPELEYTLIADYNLPLNERLEMMLGADYSYTDETNSVLTRDPLFAIEDYGLLNARVGVGESTGAWKVTVWGQNVTNEYYQNGVFNTGDTVGRYAGRPRILGVTLTLRFD
jgi:outer membrane receptor protein involved in Fe transport